MTPAISIVMPVRNAGPYLRQALASVRSQTFTDYELIIINDGSSDETARIADDFSRSDTRVTVAHNDRQSGIVDALNRGIEIARAPVICRMDGDDIMHPHRLEKQYAYLTAHPDIDLVSCYVEKFSRTGIYGGFRRYTAWLNSLCDHESICRDMFVESPFAHPSVMIRSRILRKLGGYHDCGWPEDYDLWLRMMAAGARFAKVPQVLLYWRDEPSRLSRTDARYSLDQFHRCKAYHLVHGALGARRTVIIWGAKRDARRYAASLTEFGVHIAAYIDVDRKKIGNTVGNVPVISPDDVHHFPRDYPVLSYVGIAGARAKIRAWLNRAGYRDDIDCFMMA